MSFPRYERYKDSGVEWLGEVPEHWEIVALKRLAELTTGLTPPTDDQENYAEDDFYHWVRPDDLDETGASTIAKKFLSEKGWRLARKVRSEASLICCIGTIGKIGYVTRSVSTNQQITAAQFRRSHRYFYFTLCAAKSELEISSTGNVLRILNTEKLGRIFFPIPLCVEAKAIATFLDRETAKIDALISEQQRLIELLKEKRQAVISHAVTKGLNPDAPMKDSGIEWLGEVPEHWILCSFRHCLKEVFNGLTSTQVDESKETVPVTRIETISTGVIDEARLGFISAQDARQDRKLLPGDILFSNINSLNMIGNCAIYMGGREIYAGMNLLVLRSSDLVKPNWLYWLIRSSIFRQVVESLAKPAINQASISQSSINSIYISIPCKEEQTTIATFLDRETAKIDALTAEAQTAITLLQERRTALISAAVTGKIDVRGLVSVQPEAEAIA